jgi:hypothetical protein
MIFPRSDLSPSIQSTWFLDSLFSQTPTHPPVLYRCSIGFLQHRVIASSGCCNIGFLQHQLLQHRIIAYRVFVILGYCLRGIISGFWHIGFLFKIARVFVISGYCISGLWNIGFLHVGFLLMLARVFVYRVIDIGFLTIGFLISGFDL